MFCETVIRFPNAKDHLKLEYIINSSQLTVIVYVHVLDMGDKKVIVRIINKSANEQNNSWVQILLEYKQCQLNAVFRSPEGNKPS